MIKLLSILAVPAVALTATAATAGEPVKSFTHNGVTYVYDASAAADGSTVLTGRALPSGEAFRLVVKDGRVSGQANRHAVSFSVAGSRGAANGAVVSADRPARLSSAD